MTAWLRYLIAFVVGCHGFTNIPFGLLVPARLIEWQGRSRLLGGAVSGTDSTRWFERCIWWREPPFSAAQPLSRSPCRPQGGGVRWPSSAQPFGLGAFVVFYDGQARLLVAEGAIGERVALDPVSYTHLTL